ncbi:MAG TPA: hypothetical protein PKK06_05645 [Phycisphaerae bacterium]|nr:hypothetical protein [Phycisphaerae bacterium]HNU44758.1 hypothetical protein [Phycisphaerae bacterium]
MISRNPFAALELPPLFVSILPDFVLAFTFFTALCYAVLGRHFGRQRPAAAMSVALGLALAVGLVSWEAAHGWSMRDLGPFALGLVLLALVVAVFAAVQHVGGTWSGVALAVCACVLAGGLIGTPWSLRGGFVRYLAALTLLAGLAALLLHVIRHPTFLEPAPAEVVRVRHDMTDLERDVRVAEHVERSLVGLRSEAEFLISRPDVAGDFLVQIRRLLPEEGWLTERLAELREKAHYARTGHAHRIEELREFLEKLPPAARGKAAEELADRYTELRLDVRLERLDRAVAELEKRVRDLTAEAEECAANREYPKVQGLLDEAARLQAHNAKLLKLIERSEERLLAVARQVVQHTGGVSAA